MAVVSGFSNFRIRSIFWLFILFLSVSTASKQRRRNRSLLFFFPQIKKMAPICENKY